MEDASGSRASRVVMKWDRIPDPSIPFQRKVSVGIRLNWFQDSFVVMKYRMPDCRRIWGRAAL